MQSLEIIAEIAQAHDGSLGLAHSYIDALQGSGVDTIKFQMHIAEAESSEFEQFRVNFSYEDKTRYDYWQRMEFTFEQWQGLKQHCEEKGFNFLCSPFSMKAVDWLEKLNVERYKIASGETFNLLMLERICKTEKPMLLSSGMSSYDDIVRAVDFIHVNKGVFGGVFQCTTAYPTPAEKYGLNVIPELKRLLNCKVGLSDHSGEIYAGLSAVALGAEMLEMHVVFDKKMFGPDAKSSLTVEEFRMLAEGAKKINMALNNPVDKNMTDGFSELKTMFGKSLAANKTLAIDHVISSGDLETKKPGNKGIPAGEYEKVIGKKIKREVPAGSFLTDSDFE
jgi:N,N'-diacetyllegionaminate synthase